MPLYDKIINDKFSLALWELSEPFEELSKQFYSVASKKDIEKANSFKYEGRKSEWMASRLLMAKLFDEYVNISYNEQGKPYIDKGNLNISISHTRGMVAVIVSDKITAIDIEKTGNRVLRVEDKFMSYKEKLQIDQRNKAKNLLIYWSAKETLYKMHTTRGLDFKKNLFVNKFNLNKKGQIIGEIRTESSPAVHKLNYFHFHNKESDYLVVYSVGNVAHEASHHSA